MSPLLLFCNAGEIVERMEYEVQPGLKMQEWWIKDPRFIDDTDIWTKDTKSLQKQVIKECESVKDYVLHANEGKNKVIFSTWEYTNNKQPDRCIDTRVSRPLCVPWQSQHIRSEKDLE